MQQALERDGYGIASGLVPEREIARCLSKLPEIPRAGLRNAVRVPSLRGLAEVPAVQKLVNDLLGPSPRLDRAILFDKSPDANWSVPWHQDVTIAVRARIDTPGFGPWSVKDELPHVTPPAAILASIATIRIHLDDCPAENGPLQVIPRSHLRGLLTDEEIDRSRADGPIVTLEARAGDAVLFKPLTLHASAKATAPTHRRVLHLEYAGVDLPNGLQWPDWGL